jgi:C1A family cysteine protease
MQIAFFFLLEKNHLSANTTAQRTNMKLPLLCFFVIIAATCVLAGNGIPRAIDWRSRGVVGPVMNQGDCNSPALFAAVSNIASVSAITNGLKYIPLSYNFFKACEPRGGCSAGRDGFGHNVYKYVELFCHGRVLSEATWAKSNKSCIDYDKLPYSAQIERVIPIHGGEQEMMNFVAKSGPVFVRLQLDRQSLQTYRAGIFDCQQGGQDLHAALIVGFNTTTPIPYWILQNSFGSGWGESGYFQVQMFQKACGIDSLPVTIAAAKLD